MNKEQLTYKETGVDYSLMDPFKIKAQMTAMHTSENMNRFGFKEIKASRGESAYLFETPLGIFAHVEEGLGTKNLVADAFYELTGKTYGFNHVAQDTVAMIVNDMVTLGAFPISLAMHLAVAESEWFEDKVRASELVMGWAEACHKSRCVWAGGETPTLKGIIEPGTFSLSGSGIGFTQQPLQSNITANDAIILLESSGIHANGLTLARKIAQNHFDGYAAKLSDGRQYGAALLDPTHLYVGVVEDVINAGIALHYAVNITGHGWRKLMRANESFTYRITTIPQPHPVFNFIQKEGLVIDEEMYGNFNMGAGFALYVPQSDLWKTLNLINQGNYGFNAIEAGFIETGKKQVIIEPKNLVYEGETLAVR